MHPLLVGLRNAGQIKDSSWITVLPFTLYLLELDANFVCHDHLCQARLRCLPCNDELWWPVGDYFRVSVSHPSFLDSYKTVCVCFIGSLFYFGLLLALLKEFVFE